MRRVLFFLFFLFFSALCFAQQNSGLRVIGRVPGAGDSRTYQIQVGAFRQFQNAERAFERLRNASLNPAYENFLNLTRVVINGVAARDVPSCLQRIQNTGFTEVIIRIDDNRPSAPPPVITGETIFPAGIVAGIVDGNSPAANEGTPAPSTLTEEAARIVKADPIVEADPVVKTDPIVETGPSPVGVEPEQRQARLPAPENRQPAEGSRIGAEELRQHRAIVFSWNAVAGAAAYIVTIYRETPQGRREQVFQTEPVEQLSFTFENLSLFENTGTYVWQVEALNYNSQGVEQRGVPGANTFTVNVPRPGQVKTRDIGVLYGN